MRILFLSRALPHANVIGGPIIVYNRIKRLVERGHEVGLATFVARQPAPADTAELRALLLELELVPQPVGKPRVQVYSDFLFRSIPSQFDAYLSAHMQRLVGELVGRSRYDLVIAEYTEMGQYFVRNPYLPAVRRVVSCHRCATEAYEKGIALERSALRRVFRWVVWRKLRACEFGVYAYGDHVLVLTPRDRDSLLKYNRALHISVIPYGVDTQVFTLRRGRKTEEAIVFTGSYADRSNEDAVLWFVRTVWPRLKAQHPDLKFYVVGPQSGASIRTLARRDPSLVVTGRVDDIRPYLEKARVFVCPVRMGGGFRGKILEAMACGVPVVSTSLGAAGVPAMTGVNMFLADTPHGLAEHIGILLSDRRLRGSIAKRARKLVLDSFAWDSCVDALEQVLEAVMRGR